MRRTASLILNRTLVIGGMYDGVTLPSHSEAIAAAISGSKLILLPFVHLSNVESAEVFEKTVLDFLLRD
jgi:3-oxoadipate enol-lactonase